MTAATVAPSTPRARVALIPDLRELIDSAFLLGLITLGLIGFRTTYGGHAYLGLGVAGALLGLLLAHIGNRTKQPALLVGALAIVVFLVAGGIAARTDNGGSALPTPSTMHAVVGAAVHGWKQLLTSVQPVGSSDHLLVIPYLLGLLAGVSGFLLSTRVRWSPAPVAVPAALVALSILFGSSRPAAAVLQGAAFAAGAIAWVAVRQHRQAAIGIKIGQQWRRPVSAAAVLAVAVAGGYALAPHLPYAQSHARVVLHVQPPFDPSRYPSPLAGWRVYSQEMPEGLSLYKTQLLNVTGLPAGDSVRIATMDNYDGLVWGVSNAPAPGSSFGGFQRVGATLPGGEGGAVPVTIRLGSAYSGPWIPMVADTRGVHFLGTDANALAAGLRLNLATGTAAETSELGKGDSYTLRVVPPKHASLTLSALQNAQPYGGSTLPADLLEQLQPIARRFSGSTSTPMQSVAQIASAFKAGEAAKSSSDSLPGHSIGNLLHFLQGKQLLGDDEQYAAAFALLANAVGVPARVVLEALPVGGVVTGAQVHPGVDLHLAGYGWVTIHSSEFVGNKPPTVQTPQTSHTTQPHNVPPAVTALAPPPSVSLDQENSVSRHLVTRKKGNGFHLPGFVVTALKWIGLPILLLAALAGVIIGAKTLRRRRRRTRGTYGARIAHGWRELIDIARDARLAVLHQGTRREQAAVIAAVHPEATAVAHTADGAIFGPDEPSDAHVERVWAEVASARAAMMSRLSRWQRLVAMLNVVSFLPPPVQQARPTVRTSRPATEVAS